MHFNSEKRLDDVLERDYTLGEIPGTLWLPASVSEPVPLILLGHTGGLHRMYPRLAERAKHAAAAGFATATIELPGSGDRPRSADAEQARADLHRALAAGGPVDGEIIDRLVLPLVDKAVPEWQTTLDDLLALPEIAGPVGFSGGVIAIGVRLAVVDGQGGDLSGIAGEALPELLVGQHGDRLVVEQVGGWMEQGYGHGKPLPGWLEGMFDNRHYPQPPTSPSRLDSEGARQICR